MIARPQAAAAGRWPPPAAPAPGTIGLSLANAGYLSQANLTCPGPDRLIATGKRRDLEKTARKPRQPDSADEDSTAIAAMAARLAPRRHRRLPPARHLAETFHGHIKHNMGIRRLTMRGTAKHPANGCSSPPSATSRKAIAVALSSPANLCRHVATQHASTGPAARLPACPGRLTRRKEAPNYPR